MSEHIEKLRMQELSDSAEPMQFIIPLLPGFPTWRVIILSRLPQIVNHFFLVSRKVHPNPLIIC